MISSAKNNKRRTSLQCLWRCAFVALALALTPGCIAPWMSGRAPSAAQSGPFAGESRAAYNRRVFDVSWDAVRRNYYDGNFNGVNWNAARDRHRPAAEAATTDEELYGAINALLAELKDDHTRASTPAEVEQERRTEGVLIGLVSAPVDESDSRRVVIDVIPGSAAEKTGVQPGWVLVSCDGQRPGDVLGFGRLRDGQPVLCAFLDEGDKQHELTLVAGRVSMAPIRSTHVLQGGYVQMRFDRFDLDTARWVRAQLKQHPHAPGVIVDLRQNPGGEALALARALGEFFPHSVPMGEFVRRSGFNEHLRASPGWKGARYKGPVAVLVSENSGSSAEIFAHTMKQLGRAVIVGTRTAGAVLGAEVGSLPGGGELQISVRDYAGIGGTRLEGTGVAPDILVEPTRGRRSGQDRAIETAIQHLRDGPLPAARF